MKRKFTFGILLVMMIFCVAFGGALLVKPTLTANAADHLTVLDFNAVDVTIVGYETKVGNSGSTTVFPADGVSKEMWTGNIADGGTVTLKLGQAIKAGDYKEIKINMGVGSWNSSSVVTGYAVTDTEFANVAGSQNYGYGNKVAILALDPAKLADAEGNIQQIVLKRTGDSGQMFFDYISLNAYVGEKPTEDATLDFDGTEATVVGYEANVRADNTPIAFGDGSTKEIFTANIADGGTVTVQLGETYRAEWLAEIQIRMCVGAWNGAANVSAYSVTDTAFANSAGETGNCTGNAIKILTLDPSKLANADGYITQIVLKRTGGPGQLFFDYVKVILKKEATKPTGTTVLDFDATAVTVVGYETKVGASGSTGVFAADGVSKEMFTGSIADGGTVTIQFGEIYKAAWFDEINLRICVGSWNSSSVVTGYAVTDTEFANAAGSQNYGYGNKVAILTLDPAKLADGEGNIQQIVLKRTGDSGQMFFDYAEMVIYETAEATAKETKNMDFDGKAAMVVGTVDWQAKVAADNTPIVFGDGSTKQSYTGTITSGGTATVQLGTPVLADSVSTVSLRMCVGSWGSGTDITAHSVTDTNFENPAVSQRFEYGNIIKTITLDPAKLADENGRIEQIVIRRVGDSGQMFFDYIEFETSNVYMLKGASVRMATPTGLGFATRIDYAYYNALTTAYGTDNVRTGTLILPTDYLIADVDFTIPSLQAKDILFLNVVNDGWRNTSSAERDGYYEFRGSITNIQEYNYGRNFSSVGYVAYYANRTWTYVYTQYSETDNSRSISWVAASALNDVKDSSTGEYIYQIGEGEVNATKYSRYSKTQRDVLQNYIVAPKEYTIVVSESASTSERNAANILARNLNLATGKTFQILSDASVVDLNAKSKYISVGKTELLKKNVFVNGASNDGYALKNIGTNLFIDGVNDRGTIYGVLDYLETLGFAFVDSECTQVPNLSSFAVEDIDVCFTPYVEVRSYLEYDVMTVYTDEATAIARKTNNPYVAGNIADYGGTNVFGFYGNQSHNMLATLQKGIELAGDGADYKTYCVNYTVGGVEKYQPCLTNSAVINYMTAAVKALVESRYASGVRYYMLTQEDSASTSGYCTCSTCTAAANTYGRSGLLVNFINAIVANLDADTSFVNSCPDYKIVTFAYAYTFAAPTVSIDASDRMVIMICPIGANHAYSVVDTTYNADTANAINGWKNYTDKFMFWLYDANYTNYVEYHPTLSGVMADNVYNLKKLGAISIMVQGAYNADNMWDDKLRAYVYSELLYKFDETAYLAGADAYVASIVTKYLTVYYGEYADEVQTVIDSLQTACKGATVGTYTSAIKSKCTKSQISGLLTTINAAIETSSGVVQTRLYAIKASLLACEYELTTIQSAWSNKTLFKETCAAAGITQWAEGTTISEKFS